MHEADRTYLLDALEQAKQRLGFCAPNPSVGAVVVKNHQILSNGYHKQAGAPHAEVEALNRLTRDEAEGATLYVTLEPCNHEGRTPPCTRLIIEKKIARVVFGFKDPNTDVIGYGQEQLIASGIPCDYLPLPDIEKFYEPYIWYCMHKRPWVTGKIALSLNGKISGVHGVRVPITGSAIQAWVHQKRFHVDAILTTHKTLFYDDPYLNARVEKGAIAKPLYILDRCLATSPQAKIFETGAPLCFFYEKSMEKNRATLEAKGARCVPISVQAYQLNLTEVLDIIGQDGQHHLWLEAGGICFQNFVLQKLMNRAYLAVGLKWLDPAAHDAFSANIFSSMQSYQWISVGDEIVCEIIW